MTTIVINPGTGPVAGATEENATANMAVLCDDLHARGVAVETFIRRPGSDRNGRYAFDLLFDEGDTHQVDMPGLPIEQVRYLGGEQSPLDFPRLYVNGSSWLWFFALNILMPVGAIRTTPDGTVAGAPYPAS